jgi:hypothetical protein
LPLKVTASRLGSASVAIIALFLSVASVGFGIWATVTRNSALFGRLTGLAGVFSLVLAALIAATGMIVWSRRALSQGDVNRRGSPLAVIQPLDRLAREKERSVKLGSLQVDDLNCAWESGSSEFTKNTFYLFPRLPPYREFITGIDDIKKFRNLSEIHKEMFSDVLSVMNMQARAAGRRRYKDSALSRLRVEEFYAAVALRSYLGMEELRRLANSRERPYGYDFRRVRIVQRTLDQMWPLDGNLIDELGAQESIALFKSIFMRSTDLILDLTLINNTDETQLVSQLAVVVEDSWTVIKGVSAADLVSPLEHYRFKLDLTQKRSTFSLDPQISLASGSVARFKVSFSIRNRSGNMAEVHFEIIGSMLLVRSELYKLSF